MKIIGITGISGEGKTTICQEIIEMANSNKLHVKGFISPAVFELNKKIAINVMNIETGEEKTLAEENTHFNQANLLGRWNFHLETIEWVKSFTSKVGECDIFIADEIGPLEIELGKGWFKILKSFYQIKCEKVIFTFRPKYVDYFIAQYPDIKIFELSEPSKIDTFYNIQKEIF